LIVAFASAGGGHGSFVAARIVLPYACLALGGCPKAAFVVTALAVAQWPVYGWLMDQTARRLLTSIFLVGLHLTLCVWLFKEGVR
jgi:hypothetical protein